MKRGQPKTYEKFEAEVNWNLFEKPLTYIKQILKKGGCDFLKKLEINYFPDTERTLSVLENFIRKCAGLESLDASEGLRQTDIVFKSEFFTRITEKQKYLKNLNLDYLILEYEKNWISLFKGLSNKTGLETLSLSNVETIRKGQKLAFGEDLFDSFTLSVAKNPGLAGLSLKNLFISGDEALTKLFYSLSKAQSLQSLSFSLADGSLKLNSAHSKLFKNSLSKMKELKNFDISGLQLENPEDLNEIFIGLRGKPLEKLNLSRIRIENLPKGEEGRKNFYPKSRESLDSLGLIDKKTLTSLNLGEFFPFFVDYGEKTEEIINLITQTINSFGSLQKLKIPIASRKYSDEVYCALTLGDILKTIKGLPLKSLNLSGHYTSLSDKDSGNIFGDFVLCAKDLEKLNLSDNGLKNRDLPLISKLLESGSLKKLNLSSNSFVLKTLEDKDPEEEIIKNFLNAIDESKKLTYLNLTYNEADEGVRDFLKSLEGKRFIFEPESDDSASMDSKKEQEILEAIGRNYLNEDDVGTSGENQEIE